MNQPYNVHSVLPRDQQEACHFCLHQFGTGLPGSYCNAAFKWISTMANGHEDDKETSLLSNAFLLKITAFFGLLAIVTAALTIAGKLYGDRLVLDGHTTSRDVIHIAISQDVLALPANMIRFENQRKDGEAKVVNLYLSWPEMDGYTEARAARFSDPNNSRSLIFLEFSQSVMSRDMSGRLQPIYARLFKGPAEAGPAGLELHHLNERSGFGAEVLLTGKSRAGADYVVRCILPKSRDAATAADCQRDIHVGRDLTLLYHFSAELLPEWETIDAAIRAYAESHIQNGT